MKAFVLAGGLGTRLSGILDNIPKPLTRFGDRPFLEYLVIQLRSYGFCDLVFCTGYLGEQIQAYFGDGSRWGVRIAYSQEREPLGTGGALKWAVDHLGEEREFLVMNGDSFLQVDLRALAAYHKTEGALATMALVLVNDTTRFGKVEIGGNGEIVRMVEKSGGGAGLINGGIYVLSKAVLDFIPDGQVSLELDVFPKLLGKGFYGVLAEGFFIDIGVPEDHTRLQDNPEMLLRQLGQKNRGDSSC